MTRLKSTDQSFENHEYDYVIIGSGFGGSVSALRLAEKGYKVLVLEKGKWFKSEDFPKTNWNLKKWMWWPKMGFTGFFKLTFLNHVSVLSGVGVGGGSLTYANTLPKPKDAFFNSGSWSQLNDWQTVLDPFYSIAWKMLGAATNPKLYAADLAVKDLAEKMGKSSEFEPAKVGVYFGEAGKTTTDPYFEGKGPSRTGCIHCGACMTGCKHNAKNTLDKNYLYLAQQLGVNILAEKRVVDVKPMNEPSGKNGYTVHFKKSIGWFNKLETVSTKGIIFSGGVLGTVPLLLRLKKGSLPLLSDAVGKNIRTNNESLTLVTSISKNPPDYSKGLAIGSILHTDEHSHLEPTRYGEGSGFFKLLTVPSFLHSSFIKRIFGSLFLWFKHPLKLLKAIFAKDYAKRTTILLFMQTLDSTLQLKLGRITEMKTKPEEGVLPKANIPESKQITADFKNIVDGIPFSNTVEILRNTPTTAHILGGCVMGENENKGVIDKENHVFNYHNMLICDGSMISANPGVNPSLSITAISEHAMSLIPLKK